MIGDYIFESFDKEEIQKFKNVLKPDYWEQYVRTCPETMKKIYVLSWTIVDGEACTKAWKRWLDYEKKIETTKERNGRGDIMENYCVICGTIIPEGRQVCPECEKNEKPKNVMTNKEWLATLKPEVWWEVVYKWLFHEYGMQYTDTRCAILGWLEEEHKPIKSCKYIIDEIFEVKSQKRNQKSGE